MASKAGHYGLYIDETCNPIKNRACRCEITKECGLMACWCHGFLRRHQNNPAFADGFHAEQLDKIKATGKAKVIAVEWFGSDIAHRLIKWRDAARIILACKNCPVNHQYLFLTKYPQKLYRQFERLWKYTELFNDGFWIGISCTDQKTFDARIPWLLKFAQAGFKTYIMFEPLWGPVEIENSIYATGRLVESEGWGIDQVIVGGQTGAYAKPMEYWWVDNIRDQCAAAGVPFWFKQPGKKFTGNDAGIKYLKQNNRLAWRADHE